MKNKVSSISLIVMIGVLVVLIVGSVPMIKFEWLIELEDVWYVNWIGEIVGFVKKNQSGGVSIADLYKTIAIFQIIVLVLQMIVSGILLKLAQAGKKFKMSAFILIILSLLQIFDPVVPLSVFFKFVSFLPIVSTVTYLVSRKIEFNSDSRKSSAPKKKTLEEIDTRKIY